MSAPFQQWQVRRFVRYNLGEGLEKKSNDFAAEVAQQTQAKAAAAAPAAAPPAPKKEEPKKAEEKKPAVQVGRVAGECKGSAWE
jgi:elongation factor Ts